MPLTKYLNKNFRSQNQILKLSNSMIKILELLFPQSIDRLPK
jgi:superfamily I DNA/RNA helicase